jgi:hypothetical protein
MMIILRMRQFLVLILVIMVMSNLTINQKQLIFIKQISFIGANSGQTQQKYGCAAVFN